MNRSGDDTPAVLDYGHRVGFGPRSEAPTYMEDRRPKSLPRRSIPDRRVRRPNPHKLNFAPSSSSIGAPPILEAQEEENDQKAFLTADITGKWEGVQRRSNICVSADPLLIYSQRRR